MIKACAGEVQSENPKAKKVEKAQVRIIHKNP
jgi:hypothetical protein